MEGGLEGEEGAAQRWEEGGELGRMWGAERKRLCSPILLREGVGVDMLRIQAFGGAQAWCESSSVSGNSGKMSLLESQVPRSVNGVESTSFTGFP